MVFVHARIVTFRFPRSSPAQWVHYIQSPRGAISRDSERAAQRNTGAQRFPPPLWISKADRSIGSNRTDRSIDQIRSDPRDIGVALSARGSSTAPRYRDRDRRAWLRFVLSRADRSHCKHRSYRAIVAARVSHLYPSTDHFPVTCFVGYHSHRRGGEREGEKNRRSSILTSRSRSISITQRSDYYFRALSKPRLSKYTRYFSTFTKKKKKRNTRGDNLHHLHTFPP